MLCLICVVGSLLTVYLYCVWKKMLFIGSKWVFAMGVIVEVNDLQPVRSWFAVLHTPQELSWFPEGLKTQ